MSAMPKYPTIFYIRLSEQDKARISRISSKHEIPASTLARKILREWLGLNEKLSEPLEETSEGTAIKSKQRSSLAA